MSVSAETLALLMAAGVNGEALVNIVRSIDADFHRTSTGLPPDSTADKRRAYDRERKAKQRADAKASADNPPEVPQESPRTSTGLPSKGTAEVPPDKGSAPNNIVKVVPLLLFEEKKEGRGSAREVDDNRSDPRGRRLSRDWCPSPELFVFGRELGLADTEIKELDDAFRDYWHAEAGQKARKLDWNKTWQNWIRRNAREVIRRRRFTTGTSDARGNREDPFTLAARREIDEMRRTGGG